MAAQGPLNPTPEQQRVWVDHTKCRYCGKQVVPYDESKGVNGWAKPGWYECLNAWGRVYLPGGATMKISDIVNKKMSIDVLSMDEETGRVEAKPVIGWFKRRGPAGQPWVSVVLKDRRPGGPFSQADCVFTPEHLIRTESGWKPAALVRRGDRVFIAETRLSGRQREFLLGTLLGDASGECRSGNTAGVKMSHCLAQSDYVDLKIRMLGSWVSRENREVKKPYRGGGHAQEQRSIFTRYSSEMRQLYDLTHRRGKKVVTKEWLSAVGPLGFAVFYQDDGTLANGRQARLCTYGFGRVGTERIAARLGELGVGSVVDHDRRCGALGYYLRMRKAETAAFMRLVGAYIHPAMRYKTTSDAPPFDESLWDPREDGVAALCEVRSVKPYRPTRRGLKRMRYCIEVAKNNNFFTRAGLAHNCDDGCETYWWSGADLRVRCRGCEGKGVAGEVMGDPVAEVLANEKCEECGGTGTAPNDWPEREDYE